MTTKTTNKFSPEVRERAVRMVQEHVGQYPTRWAAVQSIAAETGCATQTLHDRTRKAEVDGGKRAGVSSKVAEKLRALERENRELRQANEILRKASAYFAQTRGPTNVVISPGYLAQPHLASRPGAKLTVSATRSRVRHSRPRGHGTDHP